MIGRLQTPKLMLVTNRHTACLPLPDLAQQAISGGVDVVQIREKDLSGSALFALCAGVLDAVGDPAKVMVNSAAAIARALGIGLHLPEELVGKSHIEDGEFIRLSRAVHAQSTINDESLFNYSIIGHVFETGGKLGRPPLGLDRLKRIVDSLPNEAVAIGGIAPERVASVLLAGAKGIAVMSAINESPEPEVVAASYKHALELALAEPTTEMIAIQLNGKPVTIPTGTTISGYLAGKGFHERLVVVELNGSILAKKLFAETTLSVDDKVEVVHFVGGG